MSELENLRALAKKAAARPASPRIAAVLLAGSVAQGHVDAASDIDLIVYLNEPYGAEEFNTEVAAAKASGGDKHSGEDGNGFVVYHYIDGRKVDYAFAPKRMIDDMLDKMLVGFDPNSTTQLMARGIATGDALHDDGMIAAYKARLRDYPQGLAEATVRASLRFAPVWILREMGVKRGEPFVVYESVMPSMLNMVGVLAALNCQYHPGKLKGLEHFAAGLKIAPRDFAKRALSLFAAPLGQCVETFDGLARETLDLVDRHMPIVDTKPARVRYAMELVRPGDRHGR